MPEAFCNCCRKTTQHNYYPMEQQMFCRECNHKLVVTSNKYSGSNTVKV